MTFRPCFTARGAAASALCQPFRHEDQERPDAAEAAEEDRPREKLIQKGKHVLSDTELIAILIGSGNANTGISGAYLDSTTVGTGANNPFRVIQVCNDTTGPLPPGSNGSYTNGQPYDYAIVAFNNVNTRNFTGV